MLRGNENPKDYLLEPQYRIVAGELIAKRTCAELGCFRVYPVKPPTVFWCFGGEDQCEEKLSCLTGVMLGSRCCPGCYRAASWHSELWCLIAAVPPFVERVFADTDCDPIENPCPSGQTCCDGTCVPNCAADEHMCNCACSEPCPCN